MHDNCLLNGKIRQRVCSNFGLSGHLVYGTLAKYLTLARAGRQHLQHFSICFVNRTQKKKTVFLRLNVCENFVCRPLLAIMLNFLAFKYIFLLLVGLFYFIPFVKCRPNQLQNPHSQGTNRTGPSEGRAKFGLQTIAIY